MTSNRSLSWRMMAAGALAAAAMMTLGAAQQPAAPTLRTPAVKMGIDVLRENGFKELQGKRVGLIVNPASVAGDLSRTLDVIRSAPGITVTGLFGPEHGIYGDVYAGDKVPDGTDPRTGIPVHSLYGKTRKPTPEMLKDVDALVFDLQDIGCRSYTYVSTLKEVIAACAEQGKELIVLDRPNPLGGERIEGGPVNTGYESFVSAVPTPYVHGLTAGEMAMLLREKYAPQFQKLTVVKMQGWRRDMTWEDTGLSWTPTSPHVPQASSVAALVATGVIGELGVLSNGVGYTLPFEIVGAPWVKGDELAEAMNRHYDAPGRAYLPASSTRPAAAGELKAPARPARTPSGLYFQSIRYRPFFATHARQASQGVHVRIDPRTPENLTEINFRLMQALDAPELLRNAKSRHDMFDKVNGGPKMREALSAGDDLEPVFAEWRKYSAEFRESRKKHLLY